MGFGGKKPSKHFLKQGKELRDALFFQVPFISLLPLMEQERGNISLRDGLMSHHCRIRPFGCGSWQVLSNPCYQAWFVELTQETRPVHRAKTKEVPAIFFSGPSRGKWETGDSSSSSWDQAMKDGFSPSFVPPLLEGYLTRGLWCEAYLAGASQRFTRGMQSSCKVTGRYFVKVGEIEWNFFLKKKNLVQGLRFNFCQNLNHLLLF